MPSPSTASGHLLPIELIGRIIWQESAAIRDVFVTALTCRERLPKRESDRKEPMSCPSSTARESNTEHAQTTLAHTCFDLISDADTGTDRGRR